MYAPSDPTVHDVSLVELISICTVDVLEVKVVFPVVERPTEVDIKDPVDEDLVEKVLVAPGLCTKFCWRVWYSLMLYFHCSTTLEA